MHFQKEKEHFESQHALILTVRPPEPRRSGLTRYIYSDAASCSATYADKALESFLTTIRDVEQYLANVVSIRRLMTRETPEHGGYHVPRYDELFQFIRFCVTGENHPARLPDIHMYLDWLVTAELQHGLTPMVENPFLDVVAINGLPAESWRKSTIRWTGCCSPVAGHPGHHRCHGQQQAPQAYMRPSALRFLSPRFQPSRRVLGS